MKTTLKMGIFLLLIFCSCARINAQSYYLGEQLTLRPSQVIIENYTMVSLSKEIIDDPAANQFDRVNPYTYLQMVNDNGRNNYHILFQSSFMGKILFLAYSNNLAALFNKTEKPMFLFMRCIKRINEHLSPVQTAAAAVNCIIERLNYCAE
jgi:hypothetical protein